MFTDQRGCGCGRAMLIILGIVCIVLPILHWLDLFAGLAMPTWLGIVLIVLGAIGLVSSFKPMVKGHVSKQEKPAPAEPAAPHRSDSQCHFEWNMPFFILSIFVY